VCLTEIDGTGIRGKVHDDVLLFLGFRLSPELGLLLSIVANVLVQLGNKISLGWFLGLRLPTTAPVVFGSSAGLVEHSFGCGVLGRPRGLIHVSVSSVVRVFGHGHSFLGASSGVFTFCICMVECVGSKGRESVEAVGRSDPIDYSFLDRGGGGGALLHGNLCDEQDQVRKGQRSRARSRTRTRSEAGGADEKSGISQMLG
jgi:hypothetical protein